MSKQQTKQKPTLSFEGFGGVDRTQGHSNPACADEMLNFRICRDGSLQKRCGYRLLADVGAPIRSHWVGKIGSESACFVATDERVFSVDPISGEVSAVAPLPAKGQHAVFFFYLDSLYLLNGNRFYRLTKEKLSEVMGYVPLLGKDWDNRAVGEPFEPRNILTRKARVSYVISSPVSMFLQPPAEIESIEQVEVNGETIDPTRFEYDKNFKTINVTELNAGDRVTVYVVLAEGFDELVARLCSCLYATTFGGPSSNRLFFWGDSSPTTMFSSAYVKSDHLKEAMRTYPNCSPLYFPPDFEFIVGEGRYPVRGAQRHYDRLLIFTEGDTWIANAESSGQDDFPTSGINASIGCASYNGIALAENDPVSVGEYTVWRWSGETDRLSERNATPLSEAIDPLLSPEDYASAGLYYNRRERELWLNLPHRDEVWIYPVNHRKWYRFGGIGADHVFDLGSRVAFLRGARIFVFDESLYSDFDALGKEMPIEAFYVSTVSDFGTESRKNLCRMVLRGDLDGGRVEMTFSPVGAQDVVCTVEDGANEHSVIERRLASGSFRYGSLQLRSSDRARPVIHSLTLHTR